jgi:hypothetical protein
MPELISAEDLARQMLFSGVNGAFRDWCALLRIHPVPGRRGVYDPALVRRRLDEAQGLLQGEGVGAGLVAQRRARRGAA